MNSEHHKAEAERLLKLANKPNEEIPSWRRERFLQFAQVHATLATVPDINYCPHGDPGICMSCLRDAIRDGMQG